MNFIGNPDGKADIEKLTLRKEVRRTPISCVISVILA